MPNSRSTLLIPRYDSIVLTQLRKWLQISVRVPLSIRAALNPTGETFEYLFCVLIANQNRIDPDQENILGVNKATDVIRCGNGTIDGAKTCYGVVVNEPFVTRLMYKFESRTSMDDYAASLATASGVAKPRTKRRATAAFGFASGSNFERNASDDDQPSVVQRPKA